MPKLKTHRASQKRFRITRTGKVIRQRMTARHRVSYKSRRSVGLSKSPAPVFTAEAKKVKALMGM